MSYLTADRALLDVGIESLPVGLIGLSSRTVGTCFRIFKCPRRAVAGFSWAYVYYAKIAVRFQRMNTAPSKANPDRGQIDRTAAGGQQAPERGPQGAFYSGSRHPDSKQQQHRGTK